ncbi:hypothetical protein [Bacillus sp. SLBN-3]
MPEINNILNYFRYEDALLRGQEGYGGLRGLGVSGSAFYGLAIAYGLIYIYLISNFKNLISSKYLILLIFPLLLFGGLSAGRTSYLGIILSFLFIVRFLSKKKFGIRKININMKGILVMYLLISIIFVSIPLSNIISEDINLKVTKLTDYGFQMFYNFQKTGEFSTSSTDVLANMYFDIDDTSTYLYGKGLYTNSDGSYYMHTDAGYMRNVLYFGIGGILLLLFYQILFFEWSIKQNLLRNFICILFILIVHYKGDALGFSIIMQNILFLILLYDRHNRKFVLETNKITRKDKSNENLLLG